MGNLVPIATTTLVVILFLFAATFAIKLLNGHINTAGMLETAPDRPIDPERLLVLIGTVLAGFGYFSYGLNVGAKNGALPDLPEELVTALGGGNLLYLSGKIFRTGRII
ncbi:hypothetical protein [Neorhizobium galegae]|uniref:Uncharacterized protein n=1 Tax=Neorhizobium galegae bv. officinalis TaxID=323656 RepID=A0A0T7GHG3_NEOGA|nr:hypothetical protein [Neorhizobium galegae]CDZ46714.1 Hypothetical protein NGAL_HAMBI1189_15440 [Neorhizobium galegae bv. officinalis]